MRRTALLVLPVVLLTACSSGSDEAADDDPVVRSPQASASAGGPTDAGIEGLRVLPSDPSHTHVEGSVEYDEQPPLGGEHNPRWLACDVYDAAVPDEFAVHSLEHGAVWLAHRPDLPQAEVAQLAELARIDREYVLVSPYPGLDDAVVAVAWGRSLAVDSADDPRLEQFTRTFAGGGQGGEPGVPCRGGGVSPREAVGLLGSGSA